ITAASLRGVALYAQPGGDGSVRHGWTALGPAAAATIRSYVAAGGHYLGVCMGAYLAGSDPGMGMLAPGDTGEYDQTRGASVRTAAQAVIPVIWSGTVPGTLNRVICARLSGLPASNASEAFLSRRGLAGDRLI
ncbi:MAG TPA: BPL-N domain-containing protein, partial [Streptosporangiaceae bacterium]|nr:BPL-N domain-containing protein [Streptosporangiaceae bacterium]